MHDFSAKLLVLRLNRLGHIPTAIYSANILRQSIPVVAVEYGAVKEEQGFIEGPIPKIRLQSPLQRFLPGKLRALYVFFETFLKLGWSFYVSGPPAMVYAHGLNEQTLAYLLSRCFSFSYVVHVHEIFQSYELTPFGKALLFFEKKALRAASLLIFSEQTRRKIYQERYGLEGTTVFAANCPPLREKGLGKDLRQTLALPTQSRLMLYLGGVGESNPLEEAIDALSIAKTRFPLYFLILGWSDAEKIEALRERARERGVLDRVLFLGEVPDKWEYLDNSDFAFCVYRPNRLRLCYLATASNKFMEALAAGLPVLTSNQPDFERLVIQCGVGLTASPSSVRQMAQAMERLANDDELRKTLSLNALEAHRSQFHYEFQFAGAAKEIRAQFEGKGPQSLGPAELSSFPESV